jgi:hypothetical protein
LLTFFLFGRA